MKLLTHNFLSSRFLKGVDNGYPLKLDAVKTEIVDVPVDASFLKGVIGRVDYPALYNVAKGMGEAADLPEPVEDKIDVDSLLPQQLSQLNRVLLCIDVVEGTLECPESGRKFPIKDGIPNLLVNEDEVS